jgi:ABC-type protease/lipase transport system fused ATPase/permease subunit
VVWRPGRVYFLTLLEPSRDDRTASDARVVAVDRIAIVGCGGSGKSHLARQLGALLPVTPVHLDGLYDARDWKRLRQDQFAARQRRPGGRAAVDH